MTSDRLHNEAYVWIWLPGETQPNVAGRLAHRDDGRLVFNYGQNYLARKNAIAIYDPELPLREGEIPLHEGVQLPSSISARKAEPAVRRRKPCSSPETRNSAR